MMVSSIQVGDVYQNSRTRWQNRDICLVPLCFHKHCFGCKSIFHATNRPRKIARRVKNYGLSLGLGTSSKFVDGNSDLLYDHLIGKETSFSSFIPLFLLLFFLSIHLFPLLSILIVFTSSLLLAHLFKRYTPPQWL
jgi:hypothetical protein